MRIEQEWEGYVVDIGLSEFVARLVDLTAGSSHEEEEAIIRWLRSRTTMPRDCTSEVSSAG